MKHDILAEFEEILRDGLSEDWYDRTPLEKQRAIDALFSTSIAQAIAEERERVLGEIKEFRHKHRNLNVSSEFDIAFDNFLSSLDTTKE